MRDVFGIALAVIIGAVILFGALSALMQAQAATRKWLVQLLGRSRARWPHLKRFIQDEWRILAILAAILVGSVLGRW